MKPADIEWIASYRIDGEIYRGPLGRVYKGFDSKVGRSVAIKTVRKDLVLSEDPKGIQLERLRREAEAAETLQHPNIVQIFHYGETDDSAYIVMEFIEGRSLKDWLDSQRRFSVEEAIEIMDQVLGALDFAHQRGVVHRDIKPANIMMTGDGRVKVADFGIARVQTSTLTQAGTILGTPSYMSPEQFRGEAADLRSDLFSAGAVLFELVCGRRAFTGDLISVQRQVLTGEAPRIATAKPDLPPGIDEITARALARSREHRYPSAEAFRSALIAVLKGEDQDLEATLAGPSPAMFGAAAIDPEATLSGTPPRPPEPASEPASEADLDPDATGRRPAAAAAVPAPPPAAQVALDEETFGGAPPPGITLPPVTPPPAPAPAAPDEETFAGEAPPELKAWAVAPPSLPAGEDEGGDATVSFSDTSGRPAGVPVPPAASPPPAPPAPATAPPPPDDEGEATVSLADAIGPVPPPAPPAVTAPPPPADQGEATVSVSDIVPTAPPSEPARPAPDPSEATVSFDDVVRRPATPAPAALPPADQSDPTIALDDADRMRPPGPAAPLSPPERDALTAPAGETEAGQTPRRRSPLAAIAAVVILLVVAGGGAAWWLFGRDGPPPSPGPPLPDLGTPRDPVAAPTGSDRLDGEIAVADIGGPAEVVPAEVVPASSTGDPALSPPAPLAAEATPDAADPASPVDVVDLAPPLAPSGGWQAGETAERPTADTDTDAESRDGVVSVPPRDGPDAAPESGPAVVVADPGPSDADLLTSDADAAADPRETDADGPDPSVDPGADRPLPVADSDPAEVVPGPPSGLMIGGPMPDSPVVDGPLTDGPLTDGPAADGPVAEVAPPPPPTQLAVLPGGLPYPRLKPDPSRPIVRASVPGLGGLDLLRAEVGRRGCAVARIARTDAGAVSIRGWTGQADGEAMVRALAAQAMPGVTASVTLQRFPGTLCPALAASTGALGRAAGTGLAVRARGRDRALFREGTYLELELVAPGFSAYLSVDYFTLEGYVLHLHPNPLELTGPIGPGERMILGDPGAGGRYWVIGPPFGTELILVVASRRPLFDAPRSEVERTVDYAADLAVALGRAAGPVAASLVVTTAP